MESGCPRKGTNDTNKSISCVLISSRQIGVLSIQDALLPSFMSFAASCDIRRLLAGLRTRVKALRIDGAVNLNC
jgi:hypothetical protein